MKVNYRKFKLDKTLENFQMSFLKKGNKFENDQMCYFLKSRLKVLQFFFYFLLSFGI